MDEKQFSRYFKAFGDPSRLRILQALTSREMTVGEITIQIGLAQPTISRHLALMRDSGIVVDRREGQKVFYSLNKDAIRSCCSGFCNCLEIVVPKAKKSKKK
ncbi:MAG: metalloregulator ArsR/SmtB family transcription factor [candidate division Zixibacteria bacterium]|nr:metalloregulator ArsR/SmtB family transcription factor [candidate division Zixibacteria bacterium]